MRPISAAVKMVGTRFCLYCSDKMVNVWDSTAKQNSDIITTVIYVEKMLFQFSFFKIMKSVSLSIKTILTLLIKDTWEM